MELTSQQMLNEMTRRDITPIFDKELRERCVQRKLSADNSYTIVILPQETAKQQARIVAFAEVTTEHCSTHAVVAVDILKTVWRKGLDAVLEVFTKELDEKIDKAIERETRKLQKEEIRIARRA
ncbi:MAG: hypothetical protein NC218_01925 [Acetobacter sp.]|nr:hypothetical protein [Acetobacter sp.]